MHSKLLLTNSFFSVGVVGLVFFTAQMRDALSAKRGIAIVSRPSVCLSVLDVDVPQAYVSG